jgi:hypothetical protein
MTDWRCSVCFNTSTVTMIQGTVICQDCLKKAVETHKKSKDEEYNNLMSSIQKKISDKDIYD